jgi:hypothetical protein
VTGAVVAGTVVVEEVVGTAVDVVDRGVVVVVERGSDVDVVVAGTVEVLTVGRVVVLDAAVWTSPPAQATSSDTTAHGTSRCVTTMTVDCRRRCRYRFGLTCRRPSPLPKYSTPGQRSPFHPVAVSTNESS